MKNATRGQKKINKPSESPPNLFGFERKKKEERKIHIYIHIIANGLILTILY